MTQEEWKQVEKALEYFFKRVELQVDGYEVSLTLQRVGVYKNAIAIYVNGVFKGEWITTECEETRRFIQKREKSILTKKDKEARKKLSKKAQKELAEKYDRKYSVYSTHWSSFRALKRHLIANNESIKFVKIS